MQCYVRYIIMLHVFNKFKGHVFGVHMSTSKSIHLNCISFYEYF